MIRADLPRGPLAAQLAHAAGESAILFGRALPEGTRAVILAAADEAALLRVAARLRDRSIRHVLIHEPDAPFLGAATAIGLAPVSERREVRRALSNLPLLT